MKISCCIDMMFSEFNFYDRIAEVKKCGIHTIEFWKWSDKDMEKVKYLLDQNDMQLSIFNLDSKDEKLSHDLSRGILNAGRAEEFTAAIEESIPVYRKAGASAMIVLIGEKAPYCEENVWKCLKAAQPVCEKEKVTLILEPLNNIDRAGYSMPYAKPVLELLKKIDSPNIKMLYDIYHQSVMGDFSMEDIRENIHRIGHFHVADVPGRHEPGTGHVDYGKILKEIEGLPYDGAVGLEYRATKRDSETFGFLREGHWID